MKKSKIALIGPISGKPGGINIHLKRLVILLEDDFQFLFIDESKNTNSKIFNIRSKHIFKYIRIIWNSDIVNIHSAISLMRFFYILSAKILFKKTIMVIHAWDSSLSRIDSFFTSISAKLATKTILVNKDISKFIKIKNFVELVAFLPPNMKTEASCPSKLLKIISSFSGKIIVANAFRIDTINGKDVYGINTCIEIAKLFKNNMINAKIIFVISDISECNNAYKKYKKQISDSEILSYIELIPYPVSFVKLIQHADLVIRPTITDGDALTIREALWMEKPIIASDSVKRPKGTLLYPTDDSLAFFSIIIKVLYEDIPILKNSHIRSHDYRKDFLNAYNI